MSRSWCRSGLLRNLSWTEVFVLFQILWNQPVRAHRIFGVEERFRRRVLSRLLSDGYIRKTDDGYSLVPEHTPREGDDHGHLWLWPLRWGNVSIAARVAFILIEEQTNGRCWVNRTRLAKELGVGRTTIYAYLNELEDAGLVLPWGARRDKKIVCFNHLPSLKEHVMTGLLSHPDYVQDEPFEQIEVAGSAANTGRVGDEHREGPRRTHGLPSGLPRAHPTPAGREGGAPQDWTAPLATTLATRCRSVLQDSGARKVPRVLDRDVQQALKPYQDLPTHLRPAFSAEVERFTSTRFMWKEVLGDLILYLDSASRRVVGSAQVAQDRAARQVALCRALVKVLQEQNLYSVDALVARDRFGGTRLDEILRKNMHITPAVLALDPVLSAAASSVSHVVL